MSMTGKSRLSLRQAAWVVARRDFQAILFSKAFLLFLLGPIFFAAISLGAGMLGAKAAESGEPPRLAVMLPASQAEALVSAHRELDALISVPPIERIATGTSNSAALLSDRTRNFGAVLTGTLAQPRLIGTREQILGWQGRVALLAARAQGPDTTYPTVALEQTQSSMANTRSAQTGTATAGVTLLFLLTMLLAGMVLSNLVEEKANKIIEILAAAIPMDAVFVGKLFAMLAISFVGIAVWSSLAAIVLALGPATGASLPVPAVGWPLFAALFVLYFALAYLLIGSVFLTVGSIAATVRDVQTLSMPATILQLAVFFLATFAMTDIGSPVELFAAVFPLSSPYAMVGRAAQSSELLPHLLAIVWQVGWVAVFVRSGASLFRRRVMKSGPAATKRKRRFGLITGKMPR
jgi:ABC-2 type transport system permease protein